MAMKLISALGKIVLIAGAGSLTGFIWCEEAGKPYSTRERTIEKLCLDGLLSNVTEVHQKLSRLLDENFDAKVKVKIISSIIPAVAIAALAYGIRCGVKDILIPTNRSIAHASTEIEKKLDQISFDLEVVDLGEETNYRNEEFNNLNQRIDSLEKHFACQENSAQKERMIN